MSDIDILRLESLMGLRAILIIETKSGGVEGKARSELWLRQEVASADMRKEPTWKERLASTTISVCKIDYT